MMYLIYILVNPQVENKHMNMRQVFLTIQLIEKTSIAGNMLVFMFFLNCVFGNYFPFVPPPRKVFIHIIQGIGLNNSNDVQKTHMYRF